MAVVYLARQPALDRDVALKQLDLEGRRPHARAALRARGAARRGARPPEHRHAVRLLRGRRRARTSRWSTSAAARCARWSASSACRRSSACSRACSPASPTPRSTGIAHRDLKPENVLITPARRRQDRRLRDRARVQRADAVADEHRHGDRHAGVHGARAGARRARSARTPTSTRSASMAYEMLAGRPPFERGRRRWRCSTATSTSPRRRWPTLAPDVPERRARLGRMAAQRRRRRTARPRPPRHGRRSRRSPSPSSGRTGAGRPRSSRPRRPRTAARR